jgi:hypothetical protein
MLGFLAVGSWVPFSFGGMNGFGGPGLLDILIVGGLLLLVPLSASEAHGNAISGSSAFSTGFFRMSSLRKAGHFSYGQAPQPIPSSFEPSAVPAGFDQRNS